MDDVTLKRWTHSDFPVLERSNTPEMTRFLGGPESDDKLKKRQAKFLRLWEIGEAHMFTVNVPWAEVPVGSVGYWQVQHHGEAIYEAGWSIATAFQRRGVASLALAACLVDAAAQNDRETLFAFPRIDNPASNALCQRVGFTREGEEDFEYPPGNPIRVNAWAIALATLRDGV